MQEQIVDLLLKQEDVTWKTILYDLVRTEQMDPWDINITLLTQKYIEMIKAMQQHDFRISGKVLLAAAFLLKIKSTHLIDHDIAQLDKLLNSSEELSDDEFHDGQGDGRLLREKQQFTLIPRNPQPRNRKVSIHDLVNALQRAMATKKRILEHQRPVKFVMPERQIDIMEAIRDIYHKIVFYTAKDHTEKTTFTRLLPPRAGKQEKVYTFLPLLHLENEHKVEMEQAKPFEEIYVALAKRQNHSQK